MGSKKFCYENVHRLLLKVYGGMVNMLGLQPRSQTPHSFPSLAVRTRGEPGNEASGFAGLSFLETDLQLDYSHCRK